MENIPIFVLIAIVSNLILSGLSLSYKVYKDYKSIEGDVLTLDDLAVFETAIILESDRRKLHTVNTTGELEEIEIHDISTS